MWDAVVDQQSHTPFKDVHTCKEPYQDDCFWNLYHILSFVVPGNKLSLLTDYRARFLDIVLSSNQVGEDTQIGQVKADNDLKRKFQIEIRENEIRENGGSWAKLDIKKTWSHFYPRMYRKGHPYKPKEKRDYRPNNVDWDVERLFKVNATGSGSGRVRGRWNKFDDVAYLVIQ